MGDRALRNSTPGSGILGAIEAAASSVLTVGPCILQDTIGRLLKLQCVRNLRLAGTRAIMAGIALSATAWSAQGEGVVRPLYRPGPLPVQTAFRQAAADHQIRYGNASVAQYITDLAFKLERGKPRQRLAKWRSPLTVGLAWPGSEAYLVELQLFLNRLKRLSGVEISIAGTATQADIVVRLAPSIEMRRLLGSSYCIAVPLHEDWSAFSAHFRRGLQVDWADLVRLDKATVFIPDTARPFMVRTCLREEIMQVLGPAGDFYYLAGSIFNDDQIHLQPTGFDFLVLRVLYDRRLKAGMTPDEVSRSALRVLGEIRPELGSRPARRPLSADSGWQNSFQLARFMHHPKFAASYYEQAIALTNTMAAHDPRRLLTRLEAARNLMRYAPSEARTQLQEIGEDYKALFGEGSLHEAVARLETAQVDLWFKRFSAARQTAEASLQTFLTYGREDKILEALLVRDAADNRQQRPVQPEDAGAELRSWARYALGERYEIGKPDKQPRSPFPTALALAGFFMVAWLAFGLWRRLPFKTKGF